MKGKKNNRETDMSMTFISDVGQKSAIANDTLDDISPFADIKTDDDNKYIESEKEKNNGVGENNGVGSTNEIDDDKEDSFYELNNKKGPNKFVIIILMILCLLLGSVTTYFVMNQYTKTTSSKKTTSTKVVKKEDNEEISPDSIYIKSLISDYDYITSTNALEIYDKLYSSDKTNIKDIDEDYLKALAFRKIESITSKKEISEEEFNDSLKLLFGDQVSYENKDFSIDKGCYSAEYNKDDMTYTIKEGECGSSYTKSIQRKIVKASKTNDKLEVSVAVAILDTDTNKVYTNYKDNTLTDEVEGVTEKDFSIDKNYTKLNQYKYTFKYDRENMYYYLTSIEKIKD